MTRRRWIADEFSAERAALTGAHAAHLSRTLRARVGQEFEVACGEHVRRGKVANVSDDRVEFTLGEEVTASVVMPITMLLAIFKFDRMEWAIEKCTELNATTIIPVVARRTEKHLALAATKRVERWRRIVREAAEQSRRAAPPEISDPVKLADALANGAPESSLELSRRNDSSTESAVGEEVRTGFRSSPTGAAQLSPARKRWVRLEIAPSPVGTAEALPNTLSESRTLQKKRGDSGDLRIVLAETEHEATLIDILRAQDDITSLALAVGPEGGWTADEVRLFQQSQWLAASLGETVLRAETAAIAALAIARAEL
jgi:16S rRNA (uracil1498-N3)-methyltransferase